MIVQDEYLDADEVGKLLKLHPRTVKRLASHHELPGFLMAGKWRFRRSAIEEHIRKLEQQEKELEQTKQNEQGGDNAGP